MMFHTRMTALGCAALMALLAFIANPALASETMQGLWFNPSTEGGKPSPAPVLASRYQIKVEGRQVRTHVDQYFFNPSDQWREAVYRFPLPERAAIDRMSLRIGDRVIEGVIATKPEARETYEAARREGKAAALFEASRANLFTISVANIPPRASVSIAIEFDSEVAREDTRHSLILPLVAAPRYDHPIDMDAFFANPNPHEFVQDLIRREEIAIDVKPSATGKINPVWIDAVVMPGFDTKMIKSPSHNVQVEGLEGGYLVSLQNTVPADADFKLVWNAEEGAAPHAGLIVEQADKPHVWLQIMPPAADLWQADANSKPREIIFVLDRSGSMGGGPMEQAKQALLFALSTVTAQDRLNVIAFDDAMMALFDAPQAASEINLAKAKAFINSIDARGGTEMWPPLKMAFAGKVPEGFTRQVILATDALIGYESELLKNIESTIGDARLFPIAIGAAPNHDLVQWVGDVGRGAILSIGDQDQIAEEMSGFLARIAQPAMTDIKVDWHGVAAESAPGKLGDLFPGLPLTMVAKLDSRPDAVTVSGKVAGKDWSQTIALSEAMRADEGGAIARAFGRRKLADAMRAHLLAGNEQERTRAEAWATAVALDYGLLSQFTSLVAVDTSPIRPDGEGLERSGIPANQQRDGASLDEVVVTAHKRSAAAPMMMAQGVSFSVPQTATGSQLLMVIGGLIVLLSALGIWVMVLWQRDLERRLD